MTANPPKSSPQHFLSRPDVATAAIVETGIAILHAEGRLAAEAYLRQQGIGSSMMLRLLSASGHRRSSSAARQKAAPAPACHIADSGDE